MAYNRILIATDNSIQSEHAVKKGFELAKKLEAAVALVYVIELNIPVADLNEPIFTVDLVEHQKEQVEDTLNKLVNKYGSGLDVQTFHPEGLIKDTIIKTAEEWEPDLIIMGTHSRSVIEHFFLGSIAEKTVRQSRIPVLVIPYQSK